MKLIKKNIRIYGLLALIAFAIVATSTSCNRYMTYEDGMFDDNEIYQDAANETFQLNSEIDNDDNERY